MTESCHVVGIRDSETPPLRQLSFDYAIEAIESKKEYHSCDQQLTFLSLYLEKRLLAFDVVYRYHQITLKDLL